MSKTKVLNLVVTPQPFFTQQIEAVESKGVQMDVLPVPRTQTASDNSLFTWSIIDYIRYYPQVLSRSFSSYDLVHAHFGLTAPFALAQVQRPIVLSLWGNDLFGPGEKVTKFCAKRCDEVIVRSEEMRQELGFDAHIVERGVDLEKFAPRNQEQCIREVGWNLDAYHVLFPYNPSRDKKNYPLANSIITEVNSTLDRPVVLHPVYDKPHDLIPVYMNASDLLLLTSDSEGSPNAVKEALACDLPVVSTDVGDVRELISKAALSRIGEDHTQLVDGVYECLTTDASANERIAIENLTWDRTANQILDIYNRAL